MNILWLYCLIHLAVAQNNFGKSYLSNSRLCREWACVNTRYGLLDQLPPKHAFHVKLLSRLPKGAWQETVGPVLNACYDSRPRRYSNTCPGQALWHCVFDQLIENCPEESLKKGDACSPVQTLAGTKYMFSQRVYENLQESLTSERRPSWFLNNYYSAKCCDLPQVISEKEFSGCGFTSVMHYSVDAPRYDPVRFAANMKVTTESPDSLNVSTPSTGESDTLKVVSLKDAVVTNPVDPIDCCDINEFIRPSWRAECDFKVNWNEQKRLSIENTSLETTTVLPTTTTKSMKTRDVMVVPYSCDKENCVFKKLGIVSESGSVDTDAFVKLLDKLTESEPWWSKAKARVVTTCLKKPETEYEADCDINRILACTFDVLSENCPFKSKRDVCKHTRNDAVCQVSSSKSRPRKRRDICFLPQLVTRSMLAECNLTSLNRAIEAPETLTTVNRIKKHNNFNSKYPCHDQTPSTTCLMGKMGILNKYNFMDHFKMKDRLRQFTSTLPEWAVLVDLLMSAFTNIPLYRDQCSSPKKLLNVVDTMLMTCPIARRKNTPQCAKIFNDITNTVPANPQNLTRENFNEILKHFHSVFMPTQPTEMRFGWLTQRRPKPARKIVKKPIYDYGLLNSNNVPTVRIINVKPNPMKPLILLPVYTRLPEYKNLILKPHVNDGIMRSSPFWLHTQIAVVHANVTNSDSPVSTKNPIGTNIPVSTTIPATEANSNIATKD